MKLIKTAALVLLLAATGCKESDKMTVVASANATTMQASAPYMYSGANISNKAARGQVYEYH